MPISLYLDCCALQRPFDDRSQLRVATEAEAVLKLVELFEAGDLVCFPQVRCYSKLDGSRPLPDTITA